MGESSSQVFEASRPRVRFYCIHLEGAVLREESIRKQAAHASITIEFIAAVEGAHIDIETVAFYNRQKRRRYLLDLERNEIACVLSHRLALKKFLEDPSPFCVVLEDDAKFDVAVQDEINELIARVEGFDILKLESRDRRGPVLGSVGGRKLFLPLKASHGSTAILYSKKGARKVLASLNDFYLAFDTHIGHLCGPDFVCLACWPPIVAEDVSIASSIGGRRLSKKKRGLYAWLGARYHRVRQSLTKRIYLRRHKDIVRLLPAGEPAICADLKLQAGFPGQRPAIY